MNRSSEEMLIVFGVGVARRGDEAGSAAALHLEVRARRRRAGRPAPASGWRDGKLTRSPPPFTERLQQLGEARRAA